MDSNHASSAMKPSPAYWGDNRVQRTPSGGGVGALGMWLFLASLTMLFAASMLGYIIIRITSDNSPTPGSIEPPLMLVISTVIIIASSFTIHQALGAVRRERQSTFRGLMFATCLLAGLFIVVQVPAMTTLIRDHQDMLSANPEKPSPILGLIFFLVLVHALHVLGGVIPLIVTTIKAHQGAYDHEHYGPVRYMNMYWHFLDVVWLIMFSVFFIMQ